MSADFWAGYISGAAGILIGNPLDLVKTRLQAGGAAAAGGADRGASSASTSSFRSHFDRTGTLVRGAAAPILGYGALNALLFVSYNRSLAFLTNTPYPPPTSPDGQPTPTFWQIYTAGAISGLATFVVSAPTELIKCRAQVSSSTSSLSSSTTTTSTSSWSIFRDTLRNEGLRGLYHGGAITAARDAIGYGFYFWAYEWSKALLLPSSTSTSSSSSSPAANGQESFHLRDDVKILLCGGFAGVVTWASIFPLDVVKTRLQTQVLVSASTASTSTNTRTRTSTTTATMAATDEATTSLLPGQERRRGGGGGAKRLSSWEIARHAYRTEGWQVFFRGLGFCSVRAFVVNAVQWAVYEWMMRLLSGQQQEPARDARNLSSLESATFG